MGFNFLFCFLSSPHEASDYFKEMCIFKQYFIDNTVNIFSNFNAFVYVLKSPVNFPLNYKVFLPYKTEESTLSVTRRLILKWFDTLIIGTTLPQFFVWAIDVTNIYSCTIGNLEVF